MQRPFVLAAAAAATLLTAGAAQAGGRVDWSIGINVPPIAAVVSAPGYYRAPAYYAPTVYPAYYQPYYAPRVVYAPRPRAWAPPPRYGYGWHDAGWRHEGGWRR